MYRRIHKIRDEIRDRVALRRAACFILAAERGKMKCPAKGMRILRECLYTDHSRRVDQRICGPVLESVSKRVRELEVLPR